MEARVPVVLGSKYPSAVDVCGPLAAAAFLSTFLVVRGWKRDTSNWELYLIDTAAWYGRAEQVLGEITEDRRDRFYIATKVRT